MPAMKSINNRRGGGRAPIETSLISSWKYLLVGAFIVLARLSFHLIGIVVTKSEDDAPPALRSVASATKEIQQQNLNDHKSHTIDNTELPSDADPSATNTTKTELSVATPPNKKESISHLIKQEYLQHLQSLEPFPKHLHILFPHKQYYEQHPNLPFVKHSILRFMKMNPTWNVTVHDDADMDGIIKRAAMDVDGIISMEEMILLVGNETHAAAHPVERADLARMLIMWYHGGMYVDVDSLQNPKAFDKVFQPTVKMCLPIYMNVNFAQSITCSSPKNKLYLEMIKQMSKIRMTSNKGGPVERRDGWATTNALFSMGPPLFNHVIFDLVFGNARVRGHGNVPGLVDKMKVLQEEFSDLIVTGQFHNGCRSFLADPFDGCEELERNELYELYNMSSWNKAVKRRWGVAYKDD